MAVPRRAIGDDERRLPRTPGATGTLGVVRRRRRHVAHPDSVQVGDVDTQLHGRRAEQQRQVTGTELLLAALTFGGGYLCRVLLGQQPRERSGDVSIDVAEERVHPGDRLVVEVLS